MIKPQMPGQGASDFPAQPLAIRTTGVLTTSYVVCKAHENERLRNGDIDIAPAKKVTLWIEATRGALTSIEIKPVFLGPKESDEYQEMAISTSSGVSDLAAHSYKLTASGKFMVTFPCPAASRMRIYAKGTGTVTNSDLLLNVTLMPPGGE